MLWGDVNTSILIKSWSIISVSSVLEELGRTPSPDSALENEVKTNERKHMMIVVPDIHITTEAGVAESSRHAVTKRKRKQINSGIEY